MLDNHTVSVCRLCLASNCSLRSIFDHENIDIPEVIRTVAQLVISEDDPYSKFICNRCTVFIECVVEFKAKCVTSLREAEQRLLLLEDSQIIQEIEPQARTERLKVEFIKAEEQVPILDNAVDEGEENGGSRSDCDTPEIDETTDCQEAEAQINPNPKKISTCKLCGERFPGGAKMLLFHMKSDHADDGGLPKIRQCFFCPKSYSSYQLLKFHLNFHPQKVWQCPQCEKRIEKKNVFIDHLRIHANERHYECKECGKRFTAIKYLSTHRRLHTRKKQKEKPTLVKENEPEMPQENSNVLAGHPQRNIIGGDKSLNGCDLEQLHRPTSVKIEKTAAEMHECEVCGKKLKNKSSYTNHRKSHRSDGSVARKTVPQPVPVDERKRVYLCNICGHDCGSSSNLVVHLRRHNGQSVCHCSVCGKGFPRRSDLVMHMRKHTGEKPHKCPTCGRGFSRMDKLSIHIRTHTGEKPYQCPCGRAYAQKNDLKTHQIRNFCGQNFDVSKLLTSQPTTICIKSPLRPALDAHGASSAALASIPEPYTGSTPHLMEPVPLTEVEFPPNWIPCMAPPRTFQSHEGTPVGESFTHHPKLHTSPEV